MKKVINLWNKFWFEEQDAYPIAAFRIVFGIYLLIFFLKFLPFVESMFSNQGVYSPFWIPDIAPEPIFSWLIYSLTLVLIILFILGVKTIFVTPLLLFNFLYYFFLNFAVKNSSYDRLIIIFLIILCFASINNVWSIKSPKEKIRKTSVFATRLLCLQISIFYFGAGLYKAFQPSWSNGEILEMTMASNWGTPLAFWLLRLDLPSVFYDLLTIGTIIFEILFGFLLWIRPLQKYVFTLGILFHLSIWLLLSIPEFMICATTYVLFMNPKDLENIGSSLYSRINPKRLNVGDK